MTRNRIFGWSIGMVLAAGTMAGITAAGNGQSAAGLAGAKQWLTAMDPDNDGTVDKKEFIAYMTAQFDKADADHDGTLDGQRVGAIEEELSVGEEISWGTKSKLDLLTRVEAPGD
jgi:EF hand